MVKAVCKFNVETIKKLSVKLRIKTLIGSIIFGIILLFLGVFNIVSSLSREDNQKWLFLIMGIVICLFAFYPTVTSIFTYKKNYKETIESMRLNEGELTLEFVIKEKKMEVKATQLDKVQTETVLIRNLSLIKVHRDGLGIYQNDNMYFINDSEIVSGKKDMLLRIFKNAGIKIKKG